MWPVPLLVKIIFQVLFFKGFTEGYNTLDALASLAFGIVVVSTLRNMGVENQEISLKEWLNQVLSVLYWWGLSIPYLLIWEQWVSGLFNQWKRRDCLSPNCQLLFRPTREYFTGFYRSSCLFKTGIGLSTAFSETFEEMFPKVSYQNSWQLLLFYQLFLQMSA